MSEWQTLDSWVVPPRCNAFLGVGSHRSLNVEEKLLTLMDDPDETLSRWRSDGLDDIQRWLIEEDPEPIVAHNLPKYAEARLRVYDPSGEGLRRIETWPTHALMKRGDAAIHPPFQAPATSLDCEWRLEVYSETGDADLGQAYVDIPVTLRKDDSLKKRRVAFTGDDL